MFRRTKSRQVLMMMLALTAATWALAGCSDDDPTAPIVSEDPAQLRAIHLSPDAPGVDVFLNSAAQAAVSGLQFEQGTGYLNVDAGTYQIDVSPAGRPANESVLSVPGLQLSAGTSYTAVAYNSLGSITALALVDDESNLASGSIRVRAIHTAPGVGQVDIWNIPMSGSPSMLYENVDFGAVGGYLDLPADAYTLGFDVDNDANPDVVFALPGLAAGTVANVFATNDTGGSVFLLAQLPDGTVARIDAQ